MVHVESLLRIPNRVRMFATTRALDFCRRRSVNKPMTAYMSRILVGVLITALSGSACDGATEASIGHTVADSAGVRIVTNHRAMWGTAATLDMTPKGVHGVEGRKTSSGCAKSVSGTRERRVTVLPVLSGTMKISSTPRGTLQTA